MSRKVLQHMAEARTIGVFKERQSTVRELSICVLV